MRSEEGVAFYRRREVPLLHGRRMEEVPLHLLHSCDDNPSTLKCLFTFPFKVSTLNALNFSKFNALSFNKTLLLFLFRILLITLINKHSHKTPYNISILHAEPISAISPETFSVSIEIIPALS